MTPKPDQHDGPVALQNVENLKFALKGEQMDAKHIASNLNLLNTEIKNSGGNIAKLGINIDNLKQIEQKLIAKAQYFGTEFPAEAVSALSETIRQVEGQAGTERAPESPAETGAEIISLDQARSKQSILRTIDSATSPKELDLISKDIDAFEDEFVLPAAQGSKEKNTAIETYNLMDKRLRDRRNELNKISDIRQSINS